MKTTTKKKKKKKKNHLKYIKCPDIMNIKSKTKYLTV